MSAVTIGEAWPGFGRSFTVAELDRMPDDGHRYELMDGALLVSPRPTTVHQAVAGRLYRALSAVCPEDLLVVPEPAVQLDAQTEFDPDLVVVPLDEVGDAKFTAPPLLVVEIRSPSTALFDLNQKKAEYEKFGVLSYWIVDPDPGSAGADRLRAPGPEAIERDLACERDPKNGFVLGRAQAMLRRCASTPCNTATGGTIGISGSPRSKTLRAPLP